MQGAWRIGVCVAVLLMSAGCGRNTVFSLGLPADDASVVEGDGGLLADAGPGPGDASALDTGTPGDLDASLPPADAGFPPDVDAGPPPVDGGLPPDLDAGPGPTDGGPTDSGGRPDAGTPVPDAGTPTPDAGTPPLPGAACMSDSDCGFQAPRCHPSLFICVDCLADNDCRRGQVCDTGYGFQCRSDCVNGGCGPFGECDPATNLCYACLSASDCDPGEQCHPVTRECVGCVSNADCALAPGRPFCGGDGVCTGCRTDGDCAPGETCFPEQGGFCAPATGRAQCTPCDDDAQCGGPQDLCIGYLTGGGYVDRSCARDCSNAPCDPGFSCASVRNGRMVCRPDYDMSLPTCTALRNQGAACRFDPNDVDPGCGVENAQDARCIATAVGTAGVCSYWCDDNSQCPQGTTCTPSGNVSVCL
jgi:hypothetical protein